MMSGRLVIVGVIEIIVPLTATLMIGATSILVMVLDPVACILGMENNPNYLFTTLTLDVLI
jgi:hypothetical protein